MAVSSEEFFSNKIEKELDLIILDFEIDADVTEYLDLVENDAYIQDWCKEILPDSDEF